MKKYCTICLSFEIKSIKSYYAHAAIQHPNIKISNVDLSYLIEKWDTLGAIQRRNVLLAENNYACSMCSFNKTRSCGSSILEIDHIDGNHTNNSKTNLRVLCPNCHALTPNFRNWGRNPKQKTSKRIRKGNKSFVSKSKTRLLPTANVVKLEFKNDLKFKLEKEKFENQFIEKILRLKSTNAVDFTKYGWIENVAKLTNEIPQVISRRVRRLMPDFYKEFCYSRKRYYKIKNAAEA